MKRKKAIMLAVNDEEIEKGKRTISDFKAVNKIPSDGKFIVTIEREGEAEFFGDFDVEFLKNYISTLLHIFPLEFLAVFIKEGIQVSAENNEDIVSPENNTKH